MNSLRRMGRMLEMKSVCVMGAFLTTSRLALTCSGYFIPTTQLSTDLEGIDLISCRWRAATL